MKRNPYILTARILGFILFFGWLAFCLWFGANPFAGMVSKLELFSFFICPLIYGAGLYLSIKKLQLGGIIVLISVFLFYFIMFIDNGGGAGMISVIAAIPGVLLLSAEKLWNREKQG